MEGFPFEKLVGLIVFVIVVVSQVWTAYREQNKQREAAARATVERDMRRRANDHAAQNPPSHQPKVPGAPVPPVAPQEEPEAALRDMLEALGLPVPEPQSAPPPPVRPLPAKPSAPQAQKIPTPPPPPVPKAVSTVWDDAPDVHASFLNPKGGKQRLPLPKAAIPPATRQHQQVRELREILMNKQMVQRAVMLNEILAAPKGLGRL